MVVRVTYLLAVALFTGCERSAQNARSAVEAARGALIAVIGADENHPQWLGIRGGAERYLATTPAVRGFVAAPQEGTAAALLATASRVLERHPNAVCLHVAEPETARPAIELILAEQVLLVTMGQRSGNERVSKHVDVDLPGAAELLGENLARLAAGRRSYLLVHERGRSELATTCYQRFTAAAERQYGMVLLRSEAASADGRSATAVAEELLGQFPHAGLLVTLNPDVWLAGRAGWSRDLRELNRDFQFATLSAAPVLWARLGRPAAPGDAAALVGPLDGEIGYAAVETAVRKLLSPTTLFPDPVIRCELVLPENLDEFARRYAAAANGLDVSRYLPAPDDGGPPSRGATGR